MILTSECERNLAGALSTGGVVLDASAVDACEQALTQQHAGCDWIGPWQPPTPPACLGILEGTRGPGDRCRSNLECGDGMRCLGAGPTDLGTCGAPPPPGALCGATVDTLAVYTRQDDAELHHPACQDGFCDRTRCVRLIEPGQTCRSSVECRGRCVDGECLEGEVIAGSSCSGGECSPGLRCIDGSCQEPRSTGETCKDDRECKSACVDGKCAMRCLSPAILRKLIKSQ